MSVFIGPIIAELGLARSTVSGVYLLGTLAGALAMPVVGRAIDRYGPRWVMACIGAAFGGVLVALSAVSGIVGLTAGFVGIRMAGQGALSLTATTAVAIHVQRHRGTALGVTSAVGSAGISLAPVALERLIAAASFQTAWLVEGLVVWALVLPLALLGLPRHRPDTGSEAEAPARTRPDRTGGAGGDRRGWTLRQAMRTPMFWVITGGIAVMSMLGTALIFHQIDVLGERGLSPTQAAASFLPLTAAGLAATLATGALTDHVSGRALVVASMLSLVTALVAGGFVGPGITTVGYAMALGVASNSFRTLEAALFPRYFGTAHIGAIRGFVHATTVAGAAFGPLMLSLGHDWTATYRPVLLVLTAFPLAVIVAAALARPPGDAPPAGAPPAGEPPAPGRR